MASFNKVILMGNLVRDPQLRFTPSQQAVCDFSLAVNRKWKSQDGQSKEEVSFIDCQAWGRTAEVINQYCTKGKPLMVEGRLKQDTWDDKTTGAKRSKLSVVVDTMQLLGSRESGGGEQPDEAESQAPAQRPPARQPTRAGTPGPVSRQDAPWPFQEEAPAFNPDDVPF